MTMHVIGNSLDMEMIIRADDILELDKLTTWLEKVLPAIEHIRIDNYALYVTSNDEVSMTELEIHIYNQKGYLEHEIKKSEQYSERRY